MKVTHIGTACCLLDFEETRAITDPVLDPPGRQYHHGWGAVSKKTESPAISYEELLEHEISLGLLSHDQHKDNLDDNGKKLLSKIPNVFSTKDAAKRNHFITGLAPWETAIFELKSQRVLHITAVPAKHHPPFVPELFSGQVTGFVLRLEEDEGCLYISGDTVYFNQMEEVARRFPIKGTILHNGAVRFPYLSGSGLYTMDAGQIVKALKLFDTNQNIIVHHSGWTHFTEKKMRETLSANPALQARVMNPGDTYDFEW